MTTPRSGHQSPGAGLGYQGGGAGPGYRDGGLPASSGLSFAGSLSSRQPSAIMRLPSKVLRIGRGADNEVVVADLSVSRYHAELRRGPAGFEIVDLGSHNGTFLNGQRISAAPVTELDIIGIGPATFRLVGEELQQFIDTGDVSLAARDLTVRLASGKVLLDHVSFPLGERCLLGVIGPSGAGKSTLLGALTGMRPATEGSVLYDQRDLYTHYAELRHRIGLVPQENILHTQLSARRALGYAAELRFPRDTSKAERQRRITEVLGELSLTPHADTRTDSLSGGQQKRVNVALELLTKPSLLFLDEPTSGLDPGLDKSVMEMMADLAHDGRTVIVVTHSVANLNLCDRLLVLVPGGKVAYFGPPADGLKHFSKPGWAEVFQAFDAEPDRDWAGEFRRSAYHAALRRRGDERPGRRGRPARAGSRGSAEDPQPVRPAEHPVPPVHGGHRLGPGIPGLPGGDAVRPRRGDTGDTGIEGPGRARQPGRRVAAADPGHQRVFCRSRQRGQGTGQGTVHLQPRTGGRTVLRRLPDLEADHPGADQRAAGHDHGRDRAARPAAAADWLVPEALSAGGDRCWRWACWRSSR